MDHDELAKWLLDRGFAEEKPGYGHVSAEELADALLSEFTIYRDFDGGSIRGTEKY